MHQVEAADASHRGNGALIAAALNHGVRAEDILAGFASLHQAMRDGFDRMAREMAAMRSDILDARNRRVSGLEERTA